jgi:hypothetical protein
MLLLIALKIDKYERLKLKSEDSNAYIEFKELWDTM